MVILVSILRLDGPTVCSQTRTLAAMHSKSNEGCSGSAFDMHAVQSRRTSDCVGWSRTTSARLPAQPCGNMVQLRLSILGSGDARKAAVTLRQCAL